MVGYGGLSDGWVAPLKRVVSALVSENLSLISTSAGVAFPGQRFTVEENISRRKKKSEKGTGQVKNIFLRSFRKSNFLNPSRSTNFHAYYFVRNNKPWLRLWIGCRSSINGAIISADYTCYKLSRFLIIAVLYLRCRLRESRPNSMH